MKRHPNHSIFECPLYSEFVPDFASLANLRLPSDHTVLLIVADASNVHTNTVSDVAQHLFAQGLTYVCVWGPDCGRVHDIFDEIYLGEGSSEPGHPFLSTWHHDESLSEALWYFLRCAIPDEADLPTTTFFAVTIGRADWFASVESALCDTDAFISRVLDDESGAT